MGEVGKELLRERIKNKRASEGLTELPEDLFAKKPRYDLSEDEKQKQDERRKRNKEAAEKSRKKKKEEFEKIQSENDQLNQDKCEMAAMIEKLKQDFNTVHKENQGLRLQVETLKRWIGKRASQLGLLGKHVKKDEEKMARRESSGSPVLRGDPSLHSADGGIVSDSEEQTVRADSPGSSRSPKLASPAPSDLDFQPVGIRTAARSLQNPWIVDQPAARKMSVVRNENEVIATNIPPAPQPVPQGPVEEQLVYHLPEDTILIVRGHDGQQVLMEAPADQQVALPPAQQAQNITMAAMPEVQTTEATMKPASTEVASASVSDPSVATAIDSLLKLGYKVEVPIAAEPEEAPEATSTPITVDHSYKAPEIITMPADTVESATTVTVTTTADRITTSKTTATAGYPLINGQITPDVINKLRELKELGLTVLPFPGL